MKKITVNTQAELDAVPKDFDGVIEIYGGAILNPIVVKNAFYNATVEALGNATVRAWDNATVRAWDNATVEALGNATVEAWGNATVRAWDNATVEAWCNATVEAWDNATVRACGFSQVTKISRRARVEVSAMARCIEPTADIDTFCTFHSIQRNEEKSIWYKSVHKRGSRYVADYDKKTTYTVGKTITVKNLDANRKKECGSGIHIAPLRWALEFGKDWNDLAILEVEAVTADIVLPHESDGKVRVGKIKVLREVPLEECGLLGKMIAKRNKKESEG